MNIPQSIIDAVNTLLAPYGEKFVPSGTAAGGCLNAKEAAAYLGVSKSTLWRLAKRGAIRPIHLTAATVVFARADLDAYIASCRQVNSGRAAASSSSTFSSGNE